MLAKSQLEQTEHCVIGVSMRNVDIAVDSDGVLARGVQRLVGLLGGRRHGAVQVGLVFGAHGAGCAHLFAVGG